ncbi:MAG: TIGR02594 family protein, partial [Pseudomonadota bacterium]
MPDRAELEWMAHAWAHFGAHEARGARSNPVITAMYRDSGHPHVSDDAVPWCAAFVGAVLGRAGYAGTGSLRARSYLDWGVATDALVPGAVAVLSRGSNPALGHVGFLVGATADALFLLGGNQSDQVNVTRFARSRLLGLRLPQTDAEGVADEIPAFEADATDARFAVCLAHVLRMEGGYVNDPHDPGGPTNKGVTLATFARHTGTALSDVTRAGLITALKAIS